MVWYTQSYYEEFLELLDKNIGINDYIYSINILFIAYVVVQIQNFQKKMR